MDEMVIRPSRRTAVVLGEGEASGSVQASSMPGGFGQPLKPGWSWRAPSSP